MYGFFFFSLLNISLTITLIYRLFRLNEVRKNFMEEEFGHKSKSQRLK